MAAQKKKSSKKKASLRPSYCACFWGLDAGTSKGDTLRNICKELKIPVKTISQDQLGSPTGSVAGLIGFRPSLKPFEGEAPVDEFILFNNVPGKTLDAFLAASREADAVVEAKATITKFNKVWPLIEVMNQISLEAAQNKPKL